MKIELAFAAEKKERYVKLIEEVTSEMETTKDKRELRRLKRKRKHYQETLFSLDRRCR